MFFCIHGPYNPEDEDLESSTAKYLASRTTFNPNNQAETLPDYQSDNRAIEISTVTIYILIASILLFLTVMGLLGYFYLREKRHATPGLREEEALC